MLVAGQPNVTRGTRSRRSRPITISTSRRGSATWRGSASWRSSISGTSIAYNQPVAEMLKIWGLETLKNPVAVAGAGLGAVGARRHLRPPGGQNCARRRLHHDGRAVRTLAADLPGGHRADPGVQLLARRAAELRRLFAAHAALGAARWPMGCGTWCCPSPCSPASTPPPSRCCCARTWWTSCARTTSPLPAPAACRSGRIVYGHALRNAIIPVLTYLGIAFGLMLATAPVTESVFTWPGLGLSLRQCDPAARLPRHHGGDGDHFADAGSAPPWPTDIAYVLIDPRIRLG